MAVAPTTVMPLQGKQVDEGEDAPLRGMAKASMSITAAKEVDGVDQ